MISLLTKAFLIPPCWKSSNPRGSSFSGRSDAYLVRYGCDCQVSYMQRTLPLLVSYSIIYQLAANNVNLIRGLVPGSMCEGVRPKTIIARIFTFTGSGLCRE